MIHGGKPLNGTVNVSGAKNACLPLMAASLLVRGKIVIRNVPDLRDTRTMAKLLKIIGDNGITITRRVMVIGSGGSSGGSSGGESGVESGGDAEMTALIGTMLDTTISRAEGSEKDGP